MTSQSLRSRMVSVFCLGSMLMFLSVPLPLRAQERAPLQSGDPVPSFSVADLTGKEYVLSGFVTDHRPFIVCFWSLYCAPCLREMAFLNQVYEKYKGQGLEILAVEGGASNKQQIDEILEKLKAIELKPTYPIVPDPERKVLLSFGATKTPYTYLVNAYGVVILSFEDFSGDDKAVILDKIEALFNPQPAAAQAAKGPEALTPLAQVLRSSSGEAPSLQVVEKPKGIEPSPEEEFEKNRYFGDFYYNKEDFKRSLPYYRRCLETHADSVYVMLKLGEAYARLKDYMKARDMWEAVLKVEPGNKEADDNIRRLIRGDY